MTTQTPAQKPATSSEKSLAPLLLFLLSAGFTWLLVQLVDVPDFLRNFLVVGLCLATLMRQNWFIYLVAAAALFNASDRWRSDYGIVLLPQDIYFAIALLGYLIFSLRFTDLNARVRWLHKSSVDSAEQTDRARTWLGIRPTIAGLLWVPLAMAVAVVVLWIVPYDPSTDYEWEITPTGFRSLSVLWLLAVIWFFVSGAFWWMAERENDPQRARVFARSLYCRQMHRELHGIEKRRAKRLQKQVADKRE